ncbi:Calx-beta domain-containing protein [Cytophagaceae bacterium DM2B3-1]|uniref:Calx-beta domain-containing protein n=1 Tax=Xanthocytophaga flava TaxID=3048013 RepID=A0ABT7CPH2_9BACT|nr:Calx-beta domain-containing protein [Xanthocytophaga flavus]MDJ1495426.1 Calx-beta domain-containing protein [Xanthocytophaga flavus]
MNLFSRVLLFGGVLCMSLACSKSDSTLTSVQFSETTKTVDESAGTISVTLSLGSAATQDLILAFFVGGTAVKNGDYILNTTTDSTLTIAKGSTSATISLQVIDDEAIEDDKTIELTLISVSSSGTLGSTSASLTNTITIQDNDSAPADSFQADLLWDAGTLVNLDFAILSNVVIVDNSIDSYDVYDLSEYTTGFESVKLPSSATDGEYYLAPIYESGSRSVTYTCVVNGFDFSNTTAFSETFSTTDVGYFYVYGPFTKSGSTISRTAKTGKVKLSKAVYTKTPFAKVAK